MAVNVFVDNAKVMAKGQVTIPKDVRNVLGVKSGDQVTFIVSDGEVRVANAALYAMRVLQEGMKGVAEKAGIKDEQDVVDLVKSVRSEE